MRADLSFVLLLFDPQHIDQIMSSHGKQIMQAVTLILEAEHSIEVKEQVSRASIAHKWFSDRIIYHSGTSSACRVASFWREAVVGLFLNHKMSR